MPRYSTQRGNMESGNSMAKRNGKNGTKSDHSAAGSSLGVRIRHRRTLMGLKMAELAEMVECSESMISKIENGKASPSIKALQRIGVALGTTAAALISTEEDETLVIRAAERPKLAISSLRSSDGIVMESLAAHSPNRLLQANIHVIQPGANTDGTYTHEGEDLGYILEGELGLTVED